MTHCCSCLFHSRPQCWVLSWRSCKRSAVAPVHAHCTRCRCCGSPSTLCFLAPRTRLFWRYIAQYMILAFVFVILILWIGMSIEQNYVQNGINTLQFYTIPQVCVLENVPVQDLGATTSAWYDVPSSTNLIMTPRTLINDSVALLGANNQGDDRVNENNDVIMHCGDCGQCSNPHDIAIYDATKTTLFDTTLNCGKRSIFSGRKAAYNCMMKKVGFTPGCNQCWVENIFCDMKKCIFSCFFHAVFRSGIENNGVVQALNRCTNCDEVRCGPAFIKCAGANRRRCAILTDIERNITTEVCDKVTPPDWWKNIALQRLWSQQQQQQLEGNGTGTTGTPIINPHDLNPPPPDENSTIRVATSLSGIGGRRQRRRAGHQRLRRDLHRQR